MHKKDLGFGWDNSNHLCILTLALDLGLGAQLCVTLCMDFAPAQEEEGGGSVATTEYEKKR